MRLARSCRAHLPAPALFALGLVSLVSFGASSALAQQQSLALDRFEPAPAGDRMFGVPSPFVAGDLTPHVMILGDYAHDPLVLKSLPANTSIGSVVQDQMFLNLDAALALWSRVLVDVDVPVAVVQDGGNPSGQGQTFTSPSSAQFGDLRVGARLRVWGKYHDPFQLAVQGYVWLPTASGGSGASFVSTGEVRGLPQVVVGGEISRRLVWSAGLGPEIQGSSTYGAVNGQGGVEQGAMFHWGAGLGVLLLDSRRLQLGAEASGNVVLRDVEQRTTNAELLFDARYRFHKYVEAAAGFGPGLTSGIGTPDFRGVFSLAFTPEQIADRDHDGIPDYEDACPDVPGVRDPDPAKNGCPPPPSPPPPPPSPPPPPPPPPDRDGDGIPDAQDACPDVPGVPSDDPTKNGCPLPPPDRDHDGIPDAQDACPDEPGPPNPDPKKNGCPVVHVTQTEVVILEQVQFDTGKATIKPVSSALLDTVADVLTKHTELLKLEVQGHTDNVGTRALNKGLSAARANAVRNALIKRGIDKSRLTAKGYGPDVPIADNATAEGRQANRRVQFNIVEKKRVAAP